MPVLGNMSNSLWKQYLSSVNGFPSDTFMYSKDGNIGIHKTLLVAASPFIKSLLLGLHEPCIILPDVSYKCLTHFKSLLYHAKVGFASLEELQNLSSLLKLLAVPVQNIALDCPGNVTVLQDKVDLNVDSLVKQVEILQKQMEFADSDIESDDFLVDECDAEVSKIFADDDKIEINTDDRDPLQLESDSAILSGVVKTEIMTVDIADTLNVLPGPSYTLLRPCRNKRKVASVEITSSAKKQLRKRQSQHTQEVAMVLGFHPDEATMDLDPSLQTRICCCGYTGCKIITKEQEEDLFNRYHELSYDDQSTILYSCINMTDVKRRRGYVLQSDQQRYRKCTFEYSVDIGNKKVRVCQKTLMEIYRINSGRLSTLKEKKKLGIEKPIDGRGRYTKINRAGNHTDDDRVSVLSHIYSFPYYESFDGRKYLEPKLNIKKMFRLYQDSENNPRIKYWFYRHVFLTYGNVCFDEPSTV